MIKIKAYNNYSYVSVEGEKTLEDTQIINLFKNAGIYEYTQFFSRRGHKPEAVDKAYKFFEWKKVPTGLLFLLEKSLSNYPLKLETHFDSEIYEGISYGFDFTFYDEQLKAIEKGLEEERGYFHVSTGGGKTAIMIALVGEIGGNALVIEPSIDLVNQVCKDFEHAMKIPIKKVIGRKSLEEDFDSNIVIASVDTLLSSFDELIEVGWFNQFNILELDEVHHTNFMKPSIKSVKLENGKTQKIPKPASMSSYYKIAMACNARYRFGFTATPDDKEFFINCITGPKIIEIGEDQLIEIGRLAKSTYFVYKIKLKFEEFFNKAKTNQLLNNNDRNAIILELAEYIASLGKTVLVLIDSIKYQFKYFEEHCDHFYSIGKTKIDERSELYQKLKNKEIKILISSVIREGVNIPSIDCVLRAGGNIAQGKITQETGRGKRVTFNKDEALFLDFYDDDGYKRFQDPISHRWKTKTGYLKKHSESRLEMFKKSKHATIKIFEDLSKMKEEIKNYFEK